MLVALGGLLGSGAKTLAQELARTYGAHYYEIDAKKLRTPVLTPQGDFKRLQPKSDDERMQMYERVFADFPLLSKMYPCVIVDDTLWIGAALSPGLAYRPLPRPNSDGSKER